MGHQTRATPTESQHTRTIPSHHPTPNQWQVGDASAHADSPAAPQRGQRTGRECRRTPSRARARPAHSTRRRGSPSPAPPAPHTSLSSTHKGTPPNIGHARRRLRRAALPRRRRTLSHSAFTSVSVSFSRAISWMIWPSSSFTWSSICRDDERYAIASRSPGFFRATVRTCPFES